MTLKWQLHGATTTYGVRIFDAGEPQPNSTLMLDYWGPAGGESSWPEPPPRHSFATRADLAPLEYASVGTRHTHRSELIVEHDDGLAGARWTYVDHGLDKARLAVRFVDDTGRLALTQHIVMHGEFDVVEKWIDVQNLSDDHEVLLPRVMSASWSFLAPDGARVHYLAGAWGRENNRETVDLRYGSLQIGSRQGITGHLFAPAMQIEAAGVRGAYGVSLSWSGSWTMIADAHPGGLVRVSTGVDDETTTVRLAPGRTFSTPHSLGTYSPEGADGVSRAWHRYQRAALARSISPEHQPVVYNSWFATTYDVRPDHQLALARTAAEVGVEAFVIDDGWFKGRTGDTAGLGDWTPDPSFFPDGLRPLADQVIELGLRFGLWIEPECVNPDSDLFRAHPDWVYRSPTREPVLMRNQLVLNLSLPEVRDHLVGVLRLLLTELPITYLKWDMNRPITDPGSPTSEWAISHGNGYHTLMRLLREEFPHVTVEACSGGGGRIDPAVLGISDVVWPSDETGPRDRLLIQDGFLRAYPPHVMSSWVTDLPGTRDRTPTSDGFRFVMAMAGALGVGSDLGQWTPEQRKLAATAIALYKELRPVLHTGEVYFHGDPRGSRLYALEYVTDERVVLLVWDTSRERIGDHRLDTRLTPPPRVQLVGIDATGNYQTRHDGAVHSGAALRGVGVTVPWEFAIDADILVLDRIPR